MTPLPGWILTTPASRGIGFSLTRLLLKQTSLPIVATARADLEGTKERLLAGLDGVEKSRLSVLEVDVTSKISFLLFPNTPHTLSIRTSSPPPPLWFEGERGLLIKIKKGL